MKTQRQWGALVIVLAAFCALLAVACSDALQEAPQAVSDSAQNVQQAADTSPSVRAVAGGYDVAELCEGLPTEVIVVSPESFAVDERLVRVLTAPSGACTTTVTVVPEADEEPEGSCALIRARSSVVAALQGEFGLSADRQGECDWVSTQDTATLGSSPLARPDAPGCTGIDSLTLTVNAESFNERGRVDAVAFVPETRCYVFLSATQDPDRAEPFQFGPGEECVLRHSRTPQGDCDGIAFWSGRGRGGVWTQAEAEAAVALVSLQVAARLR